MPNKVLDLKRLWVSDHPKEEEEEEWAVVYAAWDDVMEADVIQLNIVRITLEQTAEAGSHYQCRANMDSQLQHSWRSEWQTFAYGQVLQTLMYYIFQST